MTSPSNNDKTRKFFELIDHISVAMMATRDKEGGIRSRPMWVRAKEGDQDHLYCFTRDDTAKIDELNLHHGVNLAFAEKGRQEYVSVTGSAEISQDRSLIKDLWDEGMRPWFSDGPEDERIAVIRIAIEKGEYWDAPSATMITAYGWAKAKLTGEDVQKPGENAKIA